MCDGGIGSLSFGLLVFLQSIVAEALNGLVLGIPAVVQFAYHATFMMSVPVAIAVVACWLLQLLCGRWRAEATWLDRAGRIVGLLWIAIAFLNFSFLYEITSDIW